MVKQLFGKKVKIIHDKHSRGSFPKDIIGKEVFLLGLNGKGTGSDGVKYNRYMICPQNPKIKTLDDLVNVIIAGNYYHVLEPELELEKINEPKGSLKLKKKREEVLDEFGQSMVIKLKDDEKTIYLSTSLRTTLNLKDGDGIGFAIDTEKSEIYLYQELEPEQGWIIENGQIISSADWRELYQIFDSTTLYYNLNSGTISDLDYPDYEFYLLSTHDNSKKKSGSTESIETNTEDKLVQSQYWKPTNLSNDAAYIDIGEIDKSEMIAKMSKLLRPTDIKEKEETVAEKDDFDIDMKGIRSFAQNRNLSYILENLKDISNSITESNEKEKEDKKLEF